MGRDSREGYFGLPIIYSLKAKGVLPGHLSAAELPFDSQNGDVQLKQDDNSLFFL